MQDERERSLLALQAALDPYRWKLSRYKRNPMQPDIPLQWACLSSELLRARCKASCCIHRCIQPRSIAISCNQQKMNEQANWRNCSVLNENPRKTDEI